MKVLFLANLAELSGLHDAKTIDSAMPCSAEGLSYPLNLLKELSQYADVQIYSPTEHTTYKRPSPPTGIPWITSKIQTITIPKTTDVKTLVNETSPDIVIQFAESIFPFLNNFDKVPCKRVMWFPSNPAQIITDIGIREFISPANVDLVIKSVDKSNKYAFSQALIDSGVKQVWLPFSVDGERFVHNELEQIYDVAIVGNLNPAVYLLRIKAYATLSQSNLRLSGTEAYGDGYVKLINQTNIFLTCTGRYRYLIMKFLEVPACRTLLMSDTPIDAEHLGFKPYENYISLDNRDHPIWYPHAIPRYPSVESDWIFDGKELLDLVAYYLHSEEDREGIAKDGEQLVRSRHTDKIRAKELFYSLQNLVG